MARLLYIAMKTIKMASGEKTETVIKLLAKVNFEVATNLIITTDMQIHVSSHNKTIK